MLYASLQSSYKDRCKHPALSNMAFACFGRSPNATKNSPVMNPAHLLRRAFPGKGIWADPIFVQLVVVILSMESPSKHRCSWDWYWLYFLNGKLSKFFGALPLHHYPVSQIDVFSCFFKALDSLKLSQRAPPRMEPTELLKGGWLCSLPSHTHSLRSYPWTSPAPLGARWSRTGNRYSAVLYHYIKLY